MIEIENEKKEEPKGQPLVKNVEFKKNVQYKKSLKLGEIAHYHRKEDEEKSWEEACPIVEYVIKDPKGFRINDERYRGKVVVPQCLAGQFAYMDSMRANYEADVFRGKSVTKSVGAF